MTASALAILAVTAATVAAGWAYFRRYRMARPAVGVINLRDAAIGLACVVALPYLYLSAPLWLVTGLVGAAVLSAVYFALDPVLPTRWLLWVACLVIVGTDVAIGLAGERTSDLFLLVNNAVMAVVVLGTANLWAQSGVRARDIAFLAAGLTVYDAVATWQLTVMVDLMQRLSQAPVLPVVAWALADPDAALQIGLGDLLLATLYPLVFRKAFGTVAGIVAALVGLATVAVTITLLATGMLRSTVPAMVFLGPVIICQYLYWRRRGQERTTRQYLLAEPLATSEPERR